MESSTTAAQAERLDKPSLADVDVPAHLWPALRSDHAGETGAVFIYRGILDVSQDAGVRDFARCHLVTERRHLQWMEMLVPAERRSRALPLWRVAGWLTGALPALLGPAAVFRTVCAVETFVDQHYSAQVDALAADPAHSRLCGILEQCRRDEVAHRDDAAGRIGAPGLVGRIWAAMVGRGSRIGVALASRL